MDKHIKIMKKIKHIQFSNPEKSSDNKGERKEETMLEST
jgi:hypothetical protein